MKKIFKLFSTFILMASVCASVTSCRGTYPTSFVHADVINFGDDVDANFNVKTYEGKPFELHKNGDSKFEMRKRLVELNKKIDNVVMENNTAGVYAMDIAMRRIKKMQKEYKKDVNVKYTVIYVTDGLDNISTQVARNNFTFPQKRNYRTTEDYKKKMNKRIGRISRYKKNVKNKFDIYPMVFTGTDLGSVESNMIYNQIKERCNKEGYKDVIKVFPIKAIDTAKIFAKDIIKEIKENEGFVMSAEAKRNIVAEQIIKIAKERYGINKNEYPKFTDIINDALKSSDEEFAGFIYSNMNWLRGSSRGVPNLSYTYENKENDIAGKGAPEIIYGDDFTTILENFKTEFATSSFEFKVPKGYLNMEVKMMLKDDDNNEVNISGILKKTLFGRYYLKDIKTNANFNGKKSMLKSMNKNKRDQLALFVIPMLTLENKPFIVANTEEAIEQDYKNNGYWVKNSEYSKQSSATVKNYIQLIFDCSTSMDEVQIGEEKAVLKDITEFVQGSTM